jgi:predicted enzyme related to lactoylglutathione lyase
MSVVTDPYVPGTPCWVDLMVPDQQAALDFYRDLFGWQGEIGSPETGGYAVCTLKGRPVAGIMATMTPDGAPSGQAPPPAWTTYLATDDASATQKKITDGGGQVLAPVMDVMTLGRMAVASDPTGAVFGVWQAKDFAGAGIVNEAGAVVWNELRTGDTDAAASFYSAVLGITAAPMEGADGYLSLSVNGRPVGGMQALADVPTAGRSPETPSNWLTYFASEDTDSTVDALVRAGGSVLKPPFDMVAGRMAVVRDPQGGTFAVITPAPRDGS